MATDLENLTTIRSNILSQLATMTASPKPNYSIDGQSVSWQSLYDSLFSQLEKVNAQVATIQGPVEVESYGVL